MTFFERGARIRLLARRERLVESLASLAVRTRTAWATKGLASGESHEVQATEQELRAVDHALLRLLQGAYGLCDRCGRALGTQRLLAEPEAALCHDCAPHPSDS